MAPEKSVAQNPTAMYVDGLVNCSRVVSASPLLSTPLNHSCNAYIIAYCHGMKHAQQLQIGNSLNVSSCTCIHTHSEILEASHAAAQVDAPTLNLLMAPVRIRGTFWENTRSKALSRD